MIEAILGRSKLLLRPPCSAGCSKRARLSVGCAFSIYDDSSSIITPLSPSPRGDSFCGETVLLSASNDDGVGPFFEPLRPTASRFFNPFSMHYRSLESAGPAHHSRVCLPWLQPSATSLQHAWLAAPRSHCGARGTPLLVLPISGHPSRPRFSSPSISHIVSGRRCRSCSENVSAQEGPN